MKMVHSHPPELLERHFINNELVIRELQLYVECKLPYNFIHQLINKKFGINVRYNDVYHMAKSLRDYDQKFISSGKKSDVETLIDILNDLKARDPETRFAYTLDPEQTGPKGEPKLERLVF